MVETFPRMEAVEVVEVGNTEVVEVAKEPSLVA